MIKRFNPIDLLPIKNPKDENPSKDYFYTHVVQHLIQDIIRIENNGIPIDLDRVAELEDTVSNVLDKVTEKLKDNPIMLQFLEHNASKAKAAKIEAIKTKTKTYEDFIKPFNPKDKVHRTYVVNLYLGSISKANMKMDEWNLADLKKLNEIIASSFIRAMLDKDDISNHHITIEAMKQLAEDKAKIFNKNKIESKIEDTQNTSFISLFNPKSATQKREFFAYYGIDSDIKTKSENDSWSREALERIQKLLKSMLDEKETKYESEYME